MQAFLHVILSSIFDFKFTQIYLIFYQLPENLQILKTLKTNSYYIYHFKIIFANPQLHFNDVRYSLMHYVSDRKYSKVI